MTETEKLKLWHTAQRNEFINELQHAKTRQGRFEASWLHLDHPLLSGGRVLQPSDKGEGADKIRDNCEEIPLWQRLWVINYITLPRKKRQILNALKVDLRPAKAARIARVSRREMYRSIKFFKVHFAQCYQAYKALFKRKKCHTF